MNKLAGLQVLRVIACLGVFVCHLGGQLELTGIAHQITNFGARGVYLFFILSGFFGFRSKELENPNRKQGCLQYWVKRAFKILPLYYAVIVYNFVLYEFILKSVPVDSSGIGWPRYFFFISTSIPADKNFWVNLCSTWTISIFVLFYLLVPLMKKYITSLRRAAVLWGVLYIIQFVCLGRVIYAQPVFYLHYFVLGIIFYYAEEEHKVRETLIGAVAFVLGSIAINHTLTHQACAMLFLVLIMMAKELPVTNEKVQKVIHVFDSYSYTIYLAHAVVMDGIEMLRNRIGLSRGIILLIGIVVTIAGCFVVHRLIEKPFEKVGERCLHKMKKSARSLDK